MNFNLITTNVNIDEALKQFSINKSREAIRAKTESDLSKYALRIIALITLLLKDTESENLIIDIKYLESFIGCHGGSNRKAILNALAELSNTKYYIYHKGIKEPVGQLMYLKDYLYNDKTKKITLSLDATSAKYLFNTSGGYGKILWIYTFGMKSKYGQRLYELVVLEKFRTSKSFEISIKELRGMLGLNEKYANLTNFKIKVLEPGINDINNYTPFSIIYNIQKDLITFNINEKSKEEIEVIHNIILTSKQILDIIGSYKSILSTDINVSNEEFKKQKEELAKVGYMIGSSSSEMLLLQNDTEEA